MKKTCLLFIFIGAVALTCTAVKKPPVQAYTDTNSATQAVAEFPMVGEYLAGRLMTYHNIHFYMQMVRDSRQAILEDRFDAVRAKKVSPQNMDMDYIRVNLPDFSFNPQKSIKGTEIFNF